MTALCPKCENSIRELKLNALQAVIGNMTYKSAVFTCPHCNTILPATFDFIAYKNDIASAVVEKLKNR